MAKYREHFRLSPDDLELIEEALRNAISACAGIEPQDPEFEAARQYARRVNQVLGKFHNQKVFYAQVNATGVPAA